MRIVKWYLLICWILILSGINNDSFAKSKKDYSIEHQLKLWESGSSGEKLIRIWFPSQVLEIRVGQTNECQARLTDFTYVVTESPNSYKRPEGVKYFFRRSKLDNEVAFQIYSEFQKRKISDIPDSITSGMPLSIEVYEGNNHTQRNFTLSGNRRMASFYQFLQEELKLETSMNLLIKRLPPGTYSLGEGKSIQIRPTRLDIPEEDDWYEYEQEGYD